MSELPADTVEGAERLTKLARQVGNSDEADAYRQRRDERLADHDYTARVREEDETLVLYPDEWLDDGTVVLDRIEDTDRAVEIPLDAAHDEGSWEEIEAHNSAIVDAVEAEYAPEHAANVRAFADFMGNHYLARVDNATDEQIEAFREYYKRNAWPDKKQREVVETSLEHLFTVSEADCPSPASE
jgi:adenylate cyclase class IV